jgi:glycosyltransferase involved in cell wall biosynthesis
MMQALSRHEHESIAAFGYKGHIATIPNGVFLEEIDPLPPRGSFAELFPAVRGRRFITFLSRLHPVKGLDLLVDAFATLAQTYPDVDLVIVGPDYGVEATLKAQIASKGLQSRVHLIGPMWGHERFKPVVDGVCFCLPSEHEAFSVAICEAMACGAPVVITHNCNLPEAHDANAGLVIDRTVPALTAALDTVLRDPAEAQRMGERARQLVLDRFTWPVVAATSVTHYDHILAQRSHRNGR